MTSAKILSEQGLAPRRPQDALRDAVLARLARAADEGVPRDEALQDLFPNAILDAPVLRSVASALVAGSNVLFLGPTGTGKTNLAKDVWDLFPKDVFAVKGCPVQDDPFSLLDAAYAREVPPCPHCRQRFGEGPHAAADVPVERVRLREGHGFARVQGSPEVFPDYLTGALNLARLEEIGDPADPRVLEPGKVMQANRGVLLVDEIGKLPRGTQNVLLQALQEGIVSPAKSRETFPAAFVAVCTTNLEDLDHVTEPLVGRLAGVHVPFNQDRDKNRAIVDHGLRGRPGAWVPSIAREAAVTLFMGWRGAVEGLSELSEVGSNRTMIDALRRAESHATLAGAPAVSPDDVRAGAREAMLGRVRARSTEGYEQNRATVEAYLRKHWPNVAREAAEVVWCRFFVQDLKEDKSEAMRVVEDAAGAKGAKFARFAAWVRAHDPSPLPETEAAAHVFRAMEEAGIFKEGKLPGAR